MKPSTAAVAFLAPLMLFFLAGAVISDDAVPTTDDTFDSQPVAATVDARQHLILVATRIVLMTVAVVVFATVYRRSFPPAVDRWSVIVGIAGSVLWIGICELRLEPALLDAVGLSSDWLGSRSSVNPFELYPETGRRVLFLTLRFALLALLVPVAEELFLRGFLMRAVEAEDWTTLPLTKIGSTGLVTGTIYGVLSHPREFLAAAVWFSLISILMIRTGRFWNCVVAHGITNLILGIYVLKSGSWYLW